MYPIYTSDLYICSEQTSLQAHQISLPFLNENTPVLRAGFPQPSGSKPFHGCSVKAHASCSLELGLDQYYWRKDRAVPSGGSPVRAEKGVLLKNSETKLVRATSVIPNTFVEFPPQDMCLDVSHRPYLKSAFRKGIGK